MRSGIADDGALDARESLPWRPESCGARGVGVLARIGSMLGAATGKRGTTRDDALAPAAAKAHTHGVMDAVVWGARGSSPASGPAYDRYGGATCCVELRSAASDAAHHAVVLDAGTGIVPLGRELASRGIREIDLFLSHLHYDHVLGLPFFAPAHDPEVELRIHYGGADTAEGVREAIAGLFRQPFFPAGLDCFASRKSFHPMRDREALELPGGMTATPRALTHPGGATGLRIERDGGAFAYITDFEHDGGTGDEAVLALARDADVALFDATFTPDDYVPCRGWGHAHWRAALELAERAGVRRPGLFHHMHDRTDERMDAIAAEAERMLPGAFAARAGQSLAITPR